MQGFMQFRYRDGEELITTTKFRQKETSEAHVMMQAGIAWTKLLTLVKKLHASPFSFHDSRSNNKFKTKDPA